MESETTPTRDNFIPKDDDGQSRTMSDTVGQRPALSPTDGDWLTTDKIVLRLAEKFGVHRDRRSAERYCQNEKVKAFFDDAQNIWFAEQESVDRLGAQLKEIQDRQEKSSATTADKPEPADTEPENQPLQGSRSEQQTDEVYELRAKLVQLEAEVRIKSSMIDQLNTHREKDRERFIELATETGETKAEVKHLQSLLQLGDGSNTHFTVKTSEEDHDNSTESEPKFNNSSIVDDQSDSTRLM